MNNPLNQHYWDLRYEQNQLGWDLGTVSPPLKSYFDQVEDKSLKILIPGGGNSYEAEYLMQQGFTDVTVVDVSGVVIGNLRRRFATYLDRGGCISVLSSSRSNLVDHVVPLAAEITSPQVEYVLGVWDGPSLP